MPDQTPAATSTAPAPALPPADGAARIDAAHGPRTPHPLPAHVGVPPLARLHLWQIQWVRDLMIIGAVLGVIWLGYQIRIVTVPMLIALTLAYLFEPLVRWLRRRGVCSRAFAAVGIVLCSIILLVVPVTLASGFAVVQGAKAAADFASGASRVQKSLASPEDQELRTQVPDGAWRKIRDYLADRPRAGEGGAVGGAEPGGSAGGSGTPPAGDGPKAPAAQNSERPQSAISRLAGKDEVRELGARAIDWINEHAVELSSALGRNVASSGANAARAAFATAATIATIMFQAVLVTIFFYFFSTGWGRVLEFWESFIPEARRGRVLQIVGQMDRAIAGFVRGRVTICLIEMVLISLLYFLVGVPMPLLLGPLVGMMFIVPYLNMVGVPVAMLLMWLQGVHGPVVAPELFAGSGGLWWILLAPPAVHFCGHVMDDYFLNPMIQGKHTDLAVPMIVFASIAGGALAGIYGLLLAIPVAACLRILAKEVFWPRLQKWVRGEAKDVLPIGRE